MESVKSIGKISFIGSGNVATHLALAFVRKGLTVSEVFSPNTEHAEQFSSLTGCKVVDKLKNLNKKTDLIIISIPDDKIREAFKKLPEIKGIVAHTSGFTALDVLAEAKNHGVFYPLQTFSKGRYPDLSVVPVCIEAGNAQTEASLKKLSAKISDKVLIVNSEERRVLHLAAVMVNNFTNHIYAAADEFVRSKNIDFELLLPLIRETAEKIAVLKPDQAQTGPALRNDLSTLDKHKEMLNKWPGYKELYALLSQQIIKKYNG